MCGNGRTNQYMDVCHDVDDKILQLSLQIITNTVRLMYVWITLWIKLCINTAEEGFKNEI